MTDEEIDERFVDFMAGPGGGVDQLIFYIDDLENLVRWLALTFSYEDPTTGERIVNDPIWATEDQFGHPLEDGARLKATWDRVLHPDGPGDVPRETLPAGDRDLIPGEDV